MTGSVGTAFNRTEMGRMMAALDWASTPLGDPHTWPGVLRRTVQMMLTSKQQMVLFWGPYYVALYNDAYYPVIGAKHPVALGRPVREHWGELLHVLIPLLDQVVDTGEAFWAHDHPFPLYRRGFVERTYFDISYDPVPLGNGQVGGVLCLVTETTGRVLSQRRMRTLSELGMAAATVLRAEEIAREVVTMLARNPDDVPFAQLYLGESGALHRVASTLTDPGAGPELITPGDGATAGTAVAEVLATGKPVSVPAAGFTGPRVRSEPTPEIEIALVLPITGGSEVAGVLVAGVNPMYRLPGAYREFYDVLATTVSASITNAMSHEQERRRAAALAELDRAKTEFFSNVSHEFRTPLTLIAGPAEDALADQSDPLSPGQRRRLEIVRRNSGRLRRLVDDLLDVARIEAGRLQADTVALDLAQTTRGIAESFAPAVERAGLRMRIDCPPLDRPVVVDPDMWEKILLNLLSNALKYTHEGQISVALRSLDDQVELTVTDTGVGIPADQLPLLFQRFHRVRRAAGRSHEGTGIGLALVHELTRLHDGEVAVDSRPGQGSTFTVRLPCGGTATTVGTPKRTSMVSRYLDEAMQWSGRPGVQAQRPDLTAAESDDRVPRATVLIVEDNADLRGFLTTLLSPSYTVLGTADGRAALKAITRHRPDLVLTDVMMPELDGFELLAALRGEPQTAAIPVILLSARAGADAAVEGLTAGADDYLVKPFSAQDLLARVRSNLELARLRNHESAWRIALVNAVQDGLLVITTDGTVVELNDAFTALVGYGSDGLPYLAPHPWWPDAELEPDAFEQLSTAMAAVRENGEGRFVVPLRHRDGHRVWTAVAVASVRDRDGLQQLFVATHRDVTAEQVAAERRSALVRFTTHLSEARGVREVLDVGLAEFRARWGGQRAFAACWGSGGRVDLLAGHSVRTPPDAGDLDAGVHAAITAARDTGELQISTGRAGVAVPVVAGACPVVLWLGPDHRMASGELDRVLLRGLCDQLALAFARAQAFDDQRSVAITLQRSILGPTDLPPGFAVRYEPAARQLEVGGDWYDVVSLGESCVGVVVGDCVGRGLGAAAVMGQLRSACRALLLQPHHPPGQVLAALDDFAGLIPEARCTTLFCATIDLSTATVRYSSAGHPPGLLVHADGSSEVLDGAQSVPLAVMSGISGMPAPRRPEARAVLRPGSTLLLYTDGLIENRREPLARGTQRARDAVLRFRGLGPEPLAGQLAGTLLGNGHEDDVAYVIYQHPRGEPEPFNAVLPAEPARLSPLRRSLQAWLAGTVASARSIDEIVLAVSEACANAIEHAGGFDSGAVATVTGTATVKEVELQITDYGGWKPPASDSGDRGRGLLLMRRMMDDVTISADGSGTTVRLRKGL